MKDMRNMSLSQMVRRTGWDNWLERLEERLVERLAGSTIS